MARARNTRRARKTRKTRKNRGGGDDCERCPNPNCRSTLNGNNRQTYCKCNLAITMDCKDINKVCSVCGFNSNGGYS